jgi:ADP-heptose:LPS heptosyltransferase
MKIAVLRALQLGDMLCATPALRALHAEYPAARITLVGLPWAREFAARLRRYVFDFLEFPGSPGLAEMPADLQEIAKFLGKTKSAGFDLLLQMHGSGEITNPLAVLMGARRTAGFYRAGRYCPDPERYVEWRDEEHEVLRYLRLMERLGAPARGSALEFPLHEADWAQWTGIGLERGRYAIVHPGSQLPSRRWPAERFAQVADALAKQGLQVVLTGTQAERDIVSNVKRRMRLPSLDLAGMTSLGCLAALVARARLVVANDTGISHIAAALKAPSVIVASGSDPRRWAPLDRGLHRVLWHPTQCRPCAHSTCPIGHPCALGVSAGQVTREALGLAACAA